MMSALNPKGMDDLVYSTDIQVTDLEGSNALVHSIAAIAFAPIRILLKVLHNIMILPADLMLIYAESLLMISSIMLGIGILNLFFNRSVLLLLCEIPVVLLSLLWKRKASTSVVVSNKRNVISIDTNAIEDVCNSVYDKINNSL